jgi:MOSC domain-containing protein YiiM
LPELPYGAFGENFTIGGIHEAQISLGDEFAIGTAVIQVSQPRQPCWKLARRWKMRHLPGLVVENGRTGWYFRVLRPGIVSPGDDFRLLARPCPAWTISRANQVYYHHKHDAAAAAELAAVPWLSASWRDPLESRANLLAANRLSS